MIDRGNPTECNESVELRNHPLMRRGGVRNWPPVWIPLKLPVAQVIAGEIGMLKTVTYHALHPTRCHLTIEHQGEDFIGTLLFDDKSVCWLITNILKKHACSSIKDIGSLDVSYTL